MYKFIIYKFSIKKTMKCPISVFLMNIIREHSNSKDFSKEIYNTYSKSCNSNLYTKYPGATYSGLLLGTMHCL